MDQEEAESEVAALVVAKREIEDPLPLETEGNAQQFGDTKNAMPEQSNDKSFSEDGLTPPNDDYDGVKSQRYQLTKGDYKDRSHYHNHSDGGAYDEVGAYQCFHDENNSSNSNSEKQCKEEEETLSVNYDKNYVNQNQQCIYDYDHYNEDQDQLKNFVYSEHTYQKKHRAIPNRKNCLETSYGYCTTDNAMNETDKSSVLQYESRINTCSESQRFTQVEKPPAEDQKSCQERNYECLEDGADAYQRDCISSDNREVCVDREYIYSGSNYVFHKGNNSNISRDSSHDRYYNYELQNERVNQDEVSAPIAQPLSNDQSYIHQEDNGKFYDREEPINLEPESCQERNYPLQDKNNPENKAYFKKEEPYHEENFRDRDGIHGKSSTLLEDGYTCESNDTFQRNETSAVDLRVLRPLGYHASLDEFQSSYNNIKEPSNVLEASDGVCLVDHSRIEAFPSQAEYDQDTNSLKSRYADPNQSYSEEVYRDSTHHPKNKQFDCNICETTEEENYNLCDAATNTGHIKVEHKESQTALVEIRDVTVQTDDNPKVLPFAFLKNIQEEISKHICPICQRVYISKSSFDRHLRTHEKEKNNVIANVRFTTEAKLQICKRSGKNKHLKAHKPIIIQVPRSISECDVCDKIFPHPKDKDNHNCIYNPFTKTKCPECHITFYTTGALNEHIGIVHKKETEYYCIFCNKSFNAGYNFHLHLDEHLSTQ